jgi:SAM-dependent methyltransferase
MLTDRLRIAKTIGLRHTMKLAWRRIMNQQVKCFADYNNFFSGKRGLEIGGPSALFEKGNALPVYPILANLDNCLFSSKTVWTSEIQQGWNFHFEADRRKGYQYICDGTNLGEIPSGTYDCVLSCNSLEHIANPLKAINEWSRVLSDSGAIIVVVPAKDYTFDHRRPITSLAHLVEDYERNVSEDDLSHLDEILMLHDLRRDRIAGSSEQFHSRCKQNHKVRCMHHHVFNAETLVSALDFAEFQVCAVDAILPNHIAAIARKTMRNENRDNRKFIDMSAEYRKTSPFPSDRTPIPHF